jgi:hypothetical protein
LSNWKKLIVSGSQAHLASVTASNGVVITGSLVTTGSNTLIGTTQLTGSLFITGSEDIVGYLGLEPVANLSIPTNKSASYIYTSGSTNDMYFTQYQGPYTNTTRLRWLESQLSTGLLHGGVLSSTTGSTQFTVTGGEGIIVTQNAFTGSAPYPTIKLVSWPTQTLPITYSGSAKLTYVGVNNVGTIVQQDVPWGSTDINQYDTEIELGFVLHLSGSVSTGVFNAPQISYGQPQQADDFIRAFGPLKISGHTLQASGSTLSLIKSDGRAYVAGANYVASPNHPSTVVENAVTVSKIYRYYTSGSTTVFGTGVGDAGYTTIDPTKRVNTATGLLTSVATNKYSLQRVFWVPNSPRQAFVVYYGNAQYDSLIDALNAKDTEPFSETAYTAANAIFLGWIAVAGGASSLTNPSDATIAPAGIFRSIGGIGSTGTTPVSNTLAGLSDVSVGSRTAGDLLYYNGSQWENTKSLTGNYSISGSLSVGTTTITNGSITGSLQGSSSYSTNSLNASFATTASYVLNAVSSSYALSASFASSSPAVYDFGSFATPTDVGGGGNFGIVTDGDKGDITVTSSGSIWTIDSGSVTYAKIQNVTTSSVLLGRATTGAGNIEEIILGSGLTISGSTISAAGGGGGVQIQADIITGSGTWNKPAFAKKVSVYLLPGGGGGGSGARRATTSNRCGGAGGSACGYISAVFNATALSSSISVTIGAGGATGSSVTSDDTNGNDGGAGGATSFGSFIATGTNGYGRGGTTSTSVSAIDGFGSAGFLVNTTNISGRSGTTTAGSSFLTSGLGFNTSLCGGGGAGAAANITTMANGGQATASNWTTIFPQITFGTAGTDGGSGVNGSNIQIGSLLYVNTGGGGGSYKTGQVTGNGGDGGYGAGGGGGAASDNGFASGAGGKGGDGLCIVISEG